MLADTDWLANDTSEASVKATIFDKRAQRPESDELDTRKKEDLVLCRNSMNYRNLMNVLRAETIKSLLSFFQHFSISLSTDQYEKQHIWQQTLVAKHAIYGTYRCSTGR